MKKKLHVAWKKFFGGVLLISFLTATVTLSAGSERQFHGVVLFDEGHGQKFHINDKGPFGLFNLAAVFSASGFRPEISTLALDHQILKDVDILIISGPFAPYTPAEISAIQRFLSKGGHLCLMLHIAPPVNSLLHQLGINLASGVVYENENAVLAENLVKWLKRQNTLTSLAHATK